MQRQQLTINKQHLPVRCEICHQSDLFNPQTNHCARCNKISLSRLSSKTINSQQKNSDNMAFIWSYRGSLFYLLTRLYISYWTDTLPSIFHQPRIGMFLLFFTGLTLLLKIVQLVCIQLEFLIPLMARILFRKIIQKISPRRS